MRALVQGPALWWLLLAAALGTYACRALGVKLSGHIAQDGEGFRWLAAVTYAMVAALTVRMLVLPHGLLASVPLLLRLLLCAVSLAVLVSGPQRRLGPALLTGTLLLVAYGAYR